MTNVMVKVNKGFIQVNAGYMRLDKDQIETEFCKEFEATINKSPQELFKKFTDNPLFENPMAGKLLKQAQNELDEAAEKNEAKNREEL